MCVRARLHQEIPMFEFPDKGKIRAVRRLLLLLKRL